MATDESRASDGRCPLCGVRISSVLLRKRLASENADLELARCLRCSHVYLLGWNEGFDRELYAYYEDRSSASREQRYSPLNTERHRIILEAFSKRVRGRRILDVGCGEGHFVHSATEAGWDALGIDLSPEAVSLCERFGANARCIDFLDEELGRERFDAIVMSELIEHVPDPYRFFRRAAALLQPGGVLYLTTPNFDAFTRKILGALWAPIHREHISYFTSLSLERTIVRSGLQVEKLETRNVDIGALALGLPGLRRGALLAGRRLSRRQGPDVTVNGRELSQSLRSGAKRFRPLRTGISVVNQVVRVAGLGETIVVWARRPK